MRLICIYLAAVLALSCAESDANAENKTEVNNSTVKTEPKPEVIVNNCPAFKNIPLTQTELFNRLTHPCRYDKIQRPDGENEKSKPVDVYIRSYIFYMQNLDTYNLQFTLQMRFQVRYRDIRLVFEKVAPNVTTAIMGEADLKEKLWFPHVFFVNEKSSGILGTQGKDVITSIRPDGTVLFSSRLQVSLYCSMNFRKFPFDQQTCKSTIGNWIHNASYVKLHWEAEEPFAMGRDKILSEYSIVGLTLDETELDASTPGLQYGNFVGNYSSLVFTITLDRSVGYYLLDYYFPSILLVAASWVTFWLQADQTAPRAMLGTSSMLSFITLSASQTRTLAKVSYIKASEIWFIACVLFIFFSLVEFAFVNLLWRRKKHVELEKVNTTNILKMALTPSMMRRNTTINPGELKKASSDSSLNKRNSEPAGQRCFNNSLSVDSNPSYLPVTSTDDDMGSDKSVVDVVISVPGKNDDPDRKHHKHVWTTTLTHHEIAIMLDKRARLVFPCAFLVFNIFYWILVNV